MQNNLEELFGLLSVLDPEMHSSLDDFLDTYGGGTRGAPTLDQVKVRSRRRCIRVLQT